MARAGRSRMMIVRMADAADRSTHVGRSEFQCVLACCRVFIPSLSVLLDAEAYLCEAAWGDKANFVRVQVDDTLIPQTPGN